MAQGNPPRLLACLLQTSVRRPRLVVALVAAAVLLSALGIPRIRLRLDGRSLIPQGHPAQLPGDRAAQRFALKDVVVIGISHPRGIWNPATLALVAELSADLEQTEGLLAGSVASLATLPRLTIEGHTLDLRPLLARGGEVSPEVARRLERETRVLGLADGVLVSPDGRATAIYAEVEPGADRAALLGEIRRLTARPRAGPESVHLSGTALAQAVLGHAAGRDLVRLIPLVLCLLAAVLTLAFRHPAPALLSLAEVGASLIITAGALGFSGQSVFVTTLVLPVVLLVIGVSDDVYALHRTSRHLARHPGEERGRAVVEAFGEVARPILLTALSTAAGLLSLAATDLTPQRVFGVFGALSILISTLFTFTLVPALLALLPLRLAARLGRSGAREERTAGAFLAALERMGPRRLLAAVLLAVAAGALLLPRLAIEDNWVRNLPAASDVVVGDRALNRLLAGTTRVEVLAEPRGQREPSDPEVFTALGRLEEDLRSIPGVGAVAGAWSDVVRVAAALDGLPFGELCESLSRGERRLSAPEIDQALLLLASLRRSPVAERIDDRLEGARLTAFVRDASYSRIARVVEATKGAPGGGLALTPFGDGWLSYLAVDLLVVGQVRSVAIALAANAVLLLWLFRSAADTLLALAPIVVSVAGVFELMALSGAPLGIANSMFASIALGIGVDYSIHLVAHWREERRRALLPATALDRALASTGPAIVKSAAAIAAGLSVLALSEVLPNRELGILICLSLTACALATLVVVPCLVLSFATLRREVAPRVGEALLMGEAGRGNETV
jgi:predicted RND superfamily exporter protein